MIQHQQDEEGERREACPGSEGEKDAERAGDSFAAFEAEPDRIDVAEDGDYGGGHHECGGMAGRAGREVMRDADGDEALEEIEQEREDAEELCAGARDVGGADVAAAGCADVLLAEEAAPADSRRGWSRAGRRAPM